MLPGAAFIARRRRNSSVFSHFRRRDNIYSFKNKDIDAGGVHVISGRTE
jgi:hypothetical protein